MKKLRITMQSEMYTLVLRRVTIGLAVVFSTFTVSQSVDKQLRDLFDPQSQPFASAEALPSWSRLLDRIAQQAETTVAVGKTPPQ
ncbi:MAG: hypothetical protein J4G19_03715 [Pseudomonadales bacterium]|nr:hypothetical protein [Pseudomonadales bacterium]